MNEVRTLVVEPRSSSPKREAGSLVTVLTPERLFPIAAPFRAWFVCMWISSSLAHAAEEVQSRPIRTRGSRRLCAPRWVNDAVRLAD